ncbi:hypothetical protein [Leifsonia soli]|uniref:Uncharacterized protein n=1 Tax=Leifsonia soli TaxID=582665 RepID=A0A852T2N4_9MICO|nr:hypothetical protein [Leifsonia soli]NYD75135.1 hypothetical protein [Leifsonia soli]
MTFFAEDIFGGQSGLAGSDVVSFERETAEPVVIAESLEEWAANVLGDCSLLTCHPLAHAWQEEYGALRAGYRLVPKVPFVLGGEYAHPTWSTCATSKQCVPEARWRLGFTGLPTAHPIDDRGTASRKRYVTVVSSLADLRPRPTSWC